MKNYPGWISVCLILVCQTAYAQEGIGLLTGRDVGKIRGLARAAASHAFDADVDTAASDSMAMSRYELNLSVPVSQKEGVDDLSFQFIAGLLDIDTDARLPDAGDDFPGELYDIRFGATYRRTLSNNWVVGGTLLAGSPSDEPFNSWHEVAVDGNAFLRFPDKRNAWLLFLNYSNTRDFAENIPLPGFGYEFNSDHLNALLGIPFANVDWRPVENLSLTARYVLVMVRAIDLRATYRLADPISIYLGYTWDRDEYFRADRADEDDRLFYYEQRVTAGLKWKLAQDVALDIFGGWAFDRFWFEGEDYDDRHQDRLDLEDGPFIGASLTWRF